MYLCARNGVGCTQGIFKSEEEKGEIKQAQTPRIPERKENKRNKEVGS